MKMKLFGREGSKQVFELESEVNSWLAQNPEITVTHIEQCASGGSLHDTKLYISIWYSEV